MENNDLLQLTMAEASDLIHEKKLSPVELTKSYLAAIESKGSALNAYTEVYADTAENTAKAMEILQMQDTFLGPMHGIPVALKDNIDVKGKKTTASSKVWEHHISASDADVTGLLKKGGAVILGKTNMHEFAHGATTDSPLFGAAHNPWNTDRFCCGSSGGSAAAVAGGLTLTALGTDTGGSVRLPSSVCGTVGMRPTTGKVSTRGIAPLSYSLDACGPMTRSVRDNALLLNVMTGEKEDHAAKIGKSVKKAKIGILPDALFKYDQPDVIDAVKNALEIFKSLGAEVEECHIDHLDLMTKAWYTVNNVEASAWHQRHTRDQADDFGKDVLPLLQAGEFLQGVDYIQAQRYRRWLRGEFDKLFEDIDFFVFPTMPTTAVKIGDYDLEIHGETVNMLPLTCTYVCYAPTTGLPAIQLPCGLDRDGLPIGLMLLGRANGESSLYQSAAAFETQYSLYRRLPF